MLHHRNHNAFLNSGFLSEHWVVVVLLSEHHKVSWSLESKPNQTLTVTFKVYVLLINGN